MGSEGSLKRLSPMRLADRLIEVEREVRALVAETLLQVEPVRNKCHQPPPRRLRVEAAQSFRDLGVRTVGRD